MKALTILIQGLCFLSFLWSVPFFFKPPQKNNFWILVIKLGGVLSIILDCWVTINIENIYFLNGIIGLGFFIGSLSLFWHSVKINKKKSLPFAFAEFGNNHIITQGPYKYVRHPFYISYMLAWLGSSISSLNVMTVVPVFTMGFLYLKAALAEERGFESSALQLHYLHYKASTPMFIPRWNK